MKLTEAEKNVLADLYENANFGGDKDWDKVSKYFEQLAKKYHFDLDTHIIDTDGNINPVTTCAWCGGIANSRTGLKRKRRYDGHRWSKMPICTICFKKYK